MSNAGIFREFHGAIVPVSDVERSVEWYQRVLGLEARRTVPGLAVLGAGGTAHLCLFESASAGQGDTGIFPNFRADDLEVTRELLIEREVSCSEIEAMPQLRFMTIRDPDRNRIDVCEYGPDWLE